MQAAVSLRAATSLRPRSQEEHMALQNPASATVIVASLRLPSLGAAVSADVNFHGRASRSLATIPVHAAARFQGNNATASGGGLAMIVETRKKCSFLAASPFSREVTLKPPFTHSIKPKPNSVSSPFSSSLLLVFAPASVTHQSSPARRHHRFVPCHRSSPTLAFVPCDRSTCLNTTLSQLVVSSRCRLDVIARRCPIISACSPPRGHCSPLLRRIAARHCRLFSLASSWPMLVAASLLPVIVSHLYSVLDLHVPLLQCRVLSDWIDTKVKNVDILSNSIRGR
ncbi:hypothetical protein PIB30_059715 [Stylosanthes scabra]|uniref:Uncharacterized protein n=1 Tax=Stylosanthes scabra TaxID=79078 RepID=A0ABU6XLV1_9FABA|nr:hypothetical protein [Stylosanthes scabra]